MSSRERWVIYPLLFFAFCLAARDQFPYLRPEVVEIPRLSCRVIEAQLIDTKKMVATDLRADSIEGRKKIEGDVLQLNAVDTGELVCNQMLIQSTEGHRVAELGSTDDGAGRFAICNADQREAIVIAAQKESGQIESQHDNGLRMLIRATQDGGAVYVVDANDNVVAQFAVPPASTDPDERPGDRSETTSATGDNNEQTEIDTDSQEQPNPM
jgi:hypothetical protein